MAVSPIGLTERAVNVGNKGSVIPGGGKGERGKCRKKHTDPVPIRKDVEGKDSCS